MGSHDAEAKRILAAVWGPHYRFVGEEYVHRIQEAAISGEPVDAIIATARGGDNFDWVESVKILYEAIKVINVVLTLYFATQKLLTKKELAEKARAAGVEKQTTSPVVTSKVDAVIEEAVK